MTYKIGLLVVPLIISSIANMPVVEPINRPTKIPSFTALPDPDLSSLPLFTSSNSSNNNEDYFYCDQYGPFPLDDCDDFDISFTYELNTIPSQNIIERIRVFNSSGSVVSSSSKAPVDYVKGTRKTVTLLAQIHDHWSVNGLTLKFEILNSSSRTILKAYSASFVPPSQKSIPGASLKRSIYSTNSLAFYGDGEDMKEMKETFDFTTIGDYLDVDYYYRLTLNKNYFVYPNPYNLTYSSISLRFNDDENLFPYLKHQDNGDILIPLAVSRIDNYITFRLKNKLYINKRTLQVSSSYRSGYLITNDFYLPINGKKKFNNKQLYIDISNLGLDQISTSIPIKYDINHSLVGVCTEGDYCVIGGNR